jgi:hypothetical protein
VNEDAVSGVRDTGSRCLGLTTSLSADQLRSAGTDWTAPDLASAPDEVLGGGEAIRDRTELVVLI